MLLITLHYMFLTDDNVANYSSITCFYLTNYFQFSLKYSLGGSLSDLAVTGRDPDLIGEKVCVALMLLRAGLALRLFLSTTLASNDTYGEAIVAH